MSKLLLVFLWWVVLVLVQGLGDGVFFFQPVTQIDQPTALTAKRPPRGLASPNYPLIACRTANLSLDLVHLGQFTQILKDTAGELKIHIMSGLKGFSGIHRF